MTTVHLTFFAPFIGIGWLDDTFFMSIWFVNLTFKPTAPKDKP